MKMLNRVLCSFYVSMISPSVLLFVTSVMPISVQEHVIWYIFPLISYFDPFVFLELEFDVRGNILFGFFRIYVSTFMTLFLSSLGIILILSLASWASRGRHTVRKGQRV